MRKSSEQVEIEGLEKEMTFLKNRIRQDTPKVEVEYVMKMVNSCLQRVNDARRRAKWPPYGQDRPKEVVEVYE